MIGNHVSGQGAEMKQIKEKEQGQQVDPAECTCVGGKRCNRMVRQEINKVSTEAGTHCKSNELLLARRKCMLVENLFCA